ncbi:MAG: LysR family transcriptional regulator [Clostridia bacterium]|nr:LysR family transcriptional regulator [Clostridia bacterium]
MINLKHIPAIMAIVREGSVTAASKKLYVSQPALSQTIRQVENDLGAPIFNRDLRHIELTPAGELYMEAAQKIQMIDHNLRAQIADSKDRIYGRFSLGISNQRGLQLLPQVIPEFIRMYPYVKINLAEEGSGRLERMVTEGQCDIAFVTTTSKRNRLHYVLIENERLVLVAARTTNLAKRFADGTVLDIEQAQNEAFVSMSQGHSVRIIQDRLFQENGIQPHILLETHNMEAAKSITARSNAVFLVPNVYVRDSMADRARVHIYPISNTDYERHFYFCYRQGMYLTRYEKDLVRIVCDKLGVPCNLPADGA